MNRTIVATAKTVDPWDEAIRHLKRVDPYLKEVIDRVGPCRLEPREDRFSSLIGSIVSQQISAKAAAAINERLHRLSGGPHDPKKILEFSDEALRGAGLSAVKIRYVRNVARAIDEGTVPIDEFDDSWSEEAIIKSLTTIKGVGVWTAHMFLIFVLNRPDILPVGDLGVRMGIRDRHGLDELPKPAECHALAEPWRPYRSVASWYLWRRNRTD